MDNNLQKEGLTRFVIAWPLSQHIAKKTSFMTGIPEP